MDSISLPIRHHKTRRAKKPRGSKSRNLESFSKDKKRIVCLRPTNVAHCNAPRNSTSFIIDDHENSKLFWNFHDEETHQGLAVFPGVYFNENDNQVIADDDRFWDEYSERDFASAYATAHQEEIEEWNKDKLVMEISKLEKRHKDLLANLTRLDPGAYLQKLQNELLTLQETNRLLLLDLKAKIPDTTSKTTPS